MNELGSTIGVLLMALAPVIRAVLQQMQQRRRVQTYAAPRNGAVYPLSNGQGEIVARILKLEQADASFGHLADEVRALSIRQATSEQAALEDRRAVNALRTETLQMFRDIKEMLATSIKLATGEHPTVPPEASR